MSVEWYYTTNKQQMGPVSWDELRELAESGILKPHDLVWNDGLPEWIKAINQSGLFAESDDGITAPTKKAPKPPSGRRSRNDDDEDDDDEEDEREQKRQKRKREADRAKTGVGLRVGGTLAGVLALFLCCGCSCGGIGLFTIGGLSLPGAQAQTPQNYTINHLRETRNGADHWVGDVRTFHIQQGRRVRIQVVNNLQFANTDVDLYVYQGGNNIPLISDVRTPNFNRNCQVEFTAPTTGSYRVRVVNIGPGVAHACAVRFDMLN